MAPIPVETETFVHVPGGRLYVKTWTPPALTGAPILLFHDSLGCVRLWRSFPAALAGATGRRVIAYDRLGFGRSDPRAGPLPRDFVEQEGRDVAPLVLDALGVQRFVAFGHSVGGGMAAEAAAALGERCEAAIAVSSLAYVDERGRAGIRVEGAAFRAPGGLDKLARYHGDKARWVVDSWVDTWLAPSFDDYTFDAALAACFCPVLALQGDRDDYGGMDHPARIAAMARHGAMQAIPDCGHFPHRDRETALVGMAAEFLADGAPSRSK